MSFKVYLVFAVALDLAILVNIVQYAYFGYAQPTSNYPAEPHQKDSEKNIEWKWTYGKIFCFLFFSIDYSLVSIPNQRTREERKSTIFQILYNHGKMHENFAKKINWHSHTFTNQSR